MFEYQRFSALPEMETVSYPPDECERRSGICSIVQRACRQGLMISSYGTVSTRWRDNDFLITPTNVQRWDLQPGDIVQIRDRHREPSKIPSRGVRLHQEIYKRNPGINSIIITQPPNLMAFAVTRTPFNVRTIPESWILLQDVESVPFGSQFGDFSGIMKILSENRPAIIIDNDAVLITGDTLLQTFDRLEVAEFSARSLIMGSSLGKMIPINDDQVEEPGKAFIKFRI